MLNIAKRVEHNRPLEQEEYAEDKATYAETKEGAREVLAPSTMSHSNAVRCGLYLAKEKPNITR